MLTPQHRDELRQAVVNLQNSKNGLTVIDAGETLDLLDDCEAWEEMARELAAALVEAERHCPCGARPESPVTHPHVSGCRVAAVLAKFHALVSQ